MIRVRPDSGRVELIEPVGPVTYLDLSLGNRQLRVSIAGAPRYQVGEQVGIALTPQRSTFSI